MEREETLRQDNEALRRRLCEVEYAQSRLEDHAAEIVAMAEELYVARQTAERAKRHARDAAITMRAVLDAIPDAVLTIDPEWRIQALNRAGRELLVAYGRRLRGRRLSSLVRLVDGAGGFPERATLMGDVSNVEGAIDGPEGKDIPIEFSMRGFRTAGGQRFTVVLRSIVERKKAEETILKLALTDSLTGLANRNLFQRRLSDAIATSERTGKALALIYLDLDRFKSINDTFGHPVGDGLLVEVAARLTAATRRTDTVARLGGDEFAIIATEVERPESITVLAERIIDSLAEPMTIDGALVKTGTSIGISFYPRDAEDADELIRLADMALYEAKSEGRGTYHVYDQGLQSTLRQIQVIENDMRVGLVRGEFEVFYQPIVDCREERPVAAEALVRWRHPSRGLLMPDEFIPIAEERGLIRHLGRHVLREACRQNKEWQDAGAPPIRISVNVSPRQFADGSLVRDVAEALELSGLDPKWLELEITETMVTVDLGEAKRKLFELRALGVQLAIDDFGTGFSSLRQLQEFPVQRLKIDRSFITHVVDNPGDAAISRSVLGLCHNLGLEVVAEGVETSAQIRFLRDNDCHSLQGFAFGRPCSADAFFGWLREQQRAA